MPASQKNLRGRKAFFPEVKQLVLRWISDNWGDCLGVSTLAVRLHALRVSKSLGIASLDIYALHYYCEEFVAKFTFACAVGKLPKENNRRWDRKLLVYQKKVCNDGIVWSCYIFRSREIRSRITTGMAVKHPSTQIRSKSSLMKRFIRQSKET